MSEEKNSFKELQKQQEIEYKENIDKLGLSVKSNLNGISLVTDLIEMYFSKVFSYFVEITGGTENAEKQ